MKRITFLIASFVLLVVTATAQNITIHSPKGFDSLRTNIPRGEIDSISYPCKTVGVNRKALVYTPPGYSKKKGAISLDFGFRIYKAINI